MQEAVYTGFAQNVLAYCFSLCSNIATTQVIIVLVCVCMIARIRLPRTATTNGNFCTWRLGQISATSIGSGSAKGAGVGNSSSSQCSSSSNMSLRSRTVDVSSSVKDHAMASIVPGAAHEESMYHRRQVGNAVLKLFLAECEQSSLPT